MTTTTHTIANNQAVMRALGIEHLGRLATRITLDMVADSHPQLTVHMHVDETDPACHLPPHGSAEPFDLDRACQEALERVNTQTGWLAAAARVETKNAFDDARLGFYRRWFGFAGTSNREYLKMVSELFQEVSTCSD